MTPKKKIVTADDFITTTPTEIARLVNKLGRACALGESQQLNTAEMTEVESFTADEEDAFKIGRLRGGHTQR